MTTNGTLMDAWAQTFPSISAGPGNPKTEEPCAVCAEPLKADEVCYYVTQLDRDVNGRERAVCWRHVQPDAGPVRLEKL